MRPNDEANRAPPAPRRRAETRKQGVERERKAMQAGSELSGGLGDSGTAIPIVLPDEFYSSVIFLMVFATGSSFHLLKVRNKW